MTEIWVSLAEEKHFLTLVGFNKYAQFSSLKAAAVPGPGSRGSPAQDPRGALSERVQAVLAPREVCVMSHRKPACDQELYPRPAPVLARPRGAAMPDCCACLVRAQRLLWKSSRAACESRLPQAGVAQALCGRGQQRWGVPLGDAVQAVHGGGWGAAVSAPNTVIDCVFPLPLPFSLHPQSSALGTLFCRDPRDCLAFRDLPDPSELR